MARLLFGYMRACSISIIIAFAFFLSFSPIVFGDFSEVEIGGEWLNSEVDYWADVTGAGRSGYVVYRDTFVDWRGLFLSVNFTELYTFRGAWWHESASKGFGIWVNVTDNDSDWSFYGWIGFSDWVRVWGGQWGRNVGCGSVVNWSSGYGDSGLAHSPESYDLFLNAWVEFMVYRNTSDNRLYCFCYLYDVDVPDPYRLEHLYDGYASNEGVPVGSAFENVTVEFYFLHYGNGRFRGGMSVEVYEGVEFDKVGDREFTRGVAKEFWNFVEGLRGLLVDVLPSWLSDWVLGLGAYFDWAYGLLGSFWGVLQAVVPVLPFFLFFWVLDAGLTSVSEGSFQPMGVCVSSLVGLGQKFVSIIISVVHTVYDFIHFW